MTLPRRKGYDTKALQVILYLRQLVLDIEKGGGAEIHSRVAWLQRYLLLTAVSSPKRKRSHKGRLFPASVVAYLEREFVDNEYPTTQEKKEIAIACDLKLTQVDNWFTNKRRRR